MIKKHVTLFGQPATHACDGRCDKAWGIGNRPTTPPREGTTDDYAFLADDELGTAPIEGYGYEGGDCKPIDAKGPEDVNKWCIRACERAWMSPPGQPDATPNLPDYTTRFYNIAPHKRST